jgi:short-subunit dehydrogenase
MNGLTKALVAGAAGALTTNVLHELLRRGMRPDTPRVDLLGMQAVAKVLAALELPRLTGKALYRVTLGADLAFNSLSFALIGAAPADRSITAGAAFGLAAGLGAVMLPKRLGLDDQPTNRSTFTQVTTVALYALGGLAAGSLRRGLHAQTNAAGEFLRGKHVVITGGSRGLGFAVAKAALQAGARVTVCGRSNDALEAAVQKLRSNGGSIAGVTADVRERTDCDRLIAFATDNNGPIDVLINVAGVIEVGPFSVQTIDDFREAMDTHFWGPLHTTLAVLPGMRERGCGHIANVASIGGLVGVPHLAPYSASKFAQVGLTQALRAELATEGVNVTSIIPGLMITGSPDHAIFKGRNRAEYAWFTLSDANPLLSVSADTAAQRILRAIRKNEAQVVIGATAKLAQLLNALFPQTTAALLAFAARLLPGPGGIGTDRRTGAQSHSAWTQNPLTWLNRAAAQRNNQTGDIPDACAS